MRFMIALAVAVFTLPAFALDAVVGFSPAALPGQVPAETVVVNAIRSEARQGAQGEILVAAYEFTNKAIARALIDAKNAGVHVYAVMDKSNTEHSYSGANTLANEGITVRINSRYAIHHHKFMVFGRRDLVEGSFNFTEAAAKRNAEDTLWIRNEPALALQYAREWKRLFDESTPLAARY